MRQHPIDLLPPHIRARTLTGMVVRRYVLAVTFAAALVIVSATYAHLVADRAMQELHAVQVEADEVFRTEKTARQLQGELAVHRQKEQRYARLALPLDLSTVLATIASETPEAVTLEQLNIDVVQPRMPAASGSDATDAAPERALGIDLKGFAVSDNDIGRFIDRLSAYPLFHDVGLDYSRGRTVRSRSVREFRLLMRVDLGARYAVEIAQPDDALAQEPVEQ